jgi:hypothetical protein
MPEMPQETEEWGMIVELHEILDDLNDNQAKFIKKLYNFLDPYEPFLEQMEGLSMGEPQLKWLHSLYERYCNFDDEAAEEIYEDE